MNKWMGGWMNFDPSQEIHFNKNLSGIRGSTRDHSCEHMATSSSLTEAESNLGPSITSAALRYPHV